MQARIDVGSELQRYELALIDQLVSAKRQQTLGFSFPDVDEQWALEVRRGVAQLHRGIPEGTGLRLPMDKRFMETLLTGEGGLVKGALLGSVKVEGNLLEVRRFLSCFDFTDEAFGLTLR